MLISTAHSKLLSPPCPRRQKAYALFPKWWVRGCGSFLAKGKINKNKTKTRKELFSII